MRSIRWCPRVTATPRSLVGNYTGADVVAVYRLYMGLWIEKGVELSVIGRDRESREVRLAGGDGEVVAWNPDQMSGLYGGTEVCRREGITRTPGNEPPCITLLMFGVFDVCYRTRTNQTWQRRWRSAEKRRQG